MFRSSAKREDFTGNLILPLRSLTTTRKRVTEMVELWGTTFFCSNRDDPRMTRKILFLGSV